MTITVTVSVPAGSTVKADVGQSNTPTKATVLPGETKSFTVSDTNVITQVRESPV